MGRKYGKEIVGRRGEGREGRRRGKERRGEIRRQKTTLLVGVSVLSKYWIVMKINIIFRY